MSCSRSCPNPRPPARPHPSWPAPHAPASPRAPPNNRQSARRLRASRPRYVPADTRLASIERVCVGFTGLFPANRDVGGAWLGEDPQVGSITGAVFDGVTAQLVGPTRRPDCAPRFFPTALPLTWATLILDAGHDRPSRLATRHRDSADHPRGCPTDRDALASRGGRRPSPMTLGACTTRGILHEFVSVMAALVCLVGF